MEKVYTKEEKQKMLKDHVNVLLDKYDIFSLYTDGRLNSTVQLDSEESNIIDHIEIFLTKKETT